MRYYYMKLTPPRKTFAQDMTRDEANLMREHAAYWQTLAEKNIAIAVGPVVDPKGFFGVAIVALEDGIAARDLCGADPVMLAPGARFRWDIYPMLSVISRS